MIQRPDDVAASTRIPGRSRLLLLLGPATVLGLASFASAALAFGLDASWWAIALLPLLLVSCGRMALTAVGPLLGSWPAPTALPAAGKPPASGRTAILLPIFNEPPEPVARALQVMADALQPTDDVAFFVLSDTQDPVGAEHEARFFVPEAVSRSGIEIRYRRRSPNTGRKAGNIARFCQDHGAEFRFAIILDADSLMTADAIRALIDAINRDPRAALVQSVSYPIGGTTLFARMQQFAARLNTPLSVAGQDLWQGRHGTYWGHNAIVRLRPFIDHAVLPVLPGRPPLGGEILCHDTIEAALLLGSGWDVRLAPAITGSFETIPSNLVDFLARERRWCQGNLQHLRLLFAPGFRAASRVHIGMGILYYLAAPIGLLSTVLLFLLGAIGRGGHAVTPSRLVVDGCLSLTLFLLFAPRLAALLGVLVSPNQARQRFGGRLALLLGVLVEQAVGVLLAPIIAVSVTGFVIDTFRGRVVSWTTAARGDRTVGWSEAMRRFWPHTCLGFGAIAAVWLSRPALLGWALLFAAGLVASIPLARVLGSVGLGSAARRLRLFLTVDELAPLPEQRALFPEQLPGRPAQPLPRPLIHRPDATAASGD